MYKKFGKNNDMNSLVPLQVQEDHKISICISAVANTDKWVKK